MLRPAILLQLHLHQTGQKTSRVTVTSRSMYEYGYVRQTAHTSEQKQKYFIKCELRRVSTVKLPKALCAYLHMAAQLRCNPVSCHISSCLCSRPLVFVVGPSWFGKPIKQHTYTCIWPPQQSAPRDKVPPTTTLPCVTPLWPYKHNTCLSHDSQWHITTQHFGAWSVDTNTPNRVPVNTASSSTCTEWQMAERQEYRNKN
jgi:hypothetical protein